jgi:hypothetical protein
VKRKAVEDIKNESGIKKRFRKHSLSKSSSTNHLQCLDSLHQRSSSILSTSTNNSHSNHASPNLNSSALSIVKESISLPSIHYLHMQSAPSTNATDTFEHPQESRQLIDSLMSTIRRLQDSQSTLNTTIAQLETENNRLRREVESLSAALHESDNNTIRRQSLPDPQPSQIPPYSLPQISSSVSEKPVSLSPPGPSFSLPLPPTYSPPQRLDAIQYENNSYPSHFKHNNPPRLPPPSQLFYRPVIQQLTPPEPSQRTAAMGESHKRYSIV